ncbi:MAG: Ldh family oxidoreductase [Chloroflexi bacterium]|nr:Ldh family oxidoreductase [Chloroflexota bacterium]
MQESTPSVKVITLRAEQWQEISRRVFMGWGAPEDIADCVAKSLVEADLAGIYSHGVLRVADYVGYVKAGWWRPEGRPEVARETLVTTAVDGHHGFGQPAAHLALGVSIPKARAQGIAAATIVHTGHIGRLGEYAERAAREGVIALIAASSSGNGGVVVPYGGAERVFSTNPMAAGVPAREHPPFIMDFATTVIAAGKIELAPDKDVKIPKGWAVDAEGNPATTIRKFLEGGGLLPFGGHKGYALALLVELICGALTGAGVPKQPPQVSKPRGLGFGGNSAFMVVLDIAHFTDVDQFYANVDGLFNRLETVKPAPGFAQVMIPGAPENAQREKRRHTGITVEGAIWERIAAAAAERQVSLDDILAG